VLARAGGTRRARRAALPLPPRLGRAERRRGAHRRSARRGVGPRGVGGPASRADAFLAGAPSLAAPLAEALLALEFAVWPLVGKLRPFTRLPPEAQDAVLAELAQSRFATQRRIFAGIRSIALLGFYASPEARALVGYPMGGGASTATIADAMAIPLDASARDGAPRSLAR
jgi:hypothetical protein